VVVHVVFLWVWEIGYFLVFSILLELLLRLSIYKFGIIMHIVQQISYHSAVQFSKFRDFCCSIDDRICMISEQQSDSSITCHPSSSFMLPFFLLGWKGL
jgi:hypothetical protein